MAQGGRRPKIVEEYDLRMLGAIAARNKYERRQEEIRQAKPPDGIGLDGRPLIREKTEEEKQLERMSAMGVKVEQVQRHKKDMNSDEMRRMMDTHYMIKEVSDGLGASDNQVKHIIKTLHIQPAFRWRCGYYSKEDVQRIIDYYQGKTKYKRDRDRMISEIRDMIND